jgi:hypothetical protein
MTATKWVRIPTFAAVGTILGLLALAPQAHAKDLEGRLGLGIEQSIGGVSGLTLRYWPSVRLGVQATVGGSFANGLGEDESEVGALMGASVGILYNVSRALHANLGLGLRAAVGMRTEAMRNAGVPAGGELRSGDDVQVSLELPIVIEYFLSESFSVSVATGFLVVFVPSDGPVLTPKGHGGSTTPDTTGFAIGAGSITGSLGAVYYF